MTECSHNVVVLGASVSLPDMGTCTCQYLHMQYSAYLDLCILCVHMYLHVVMYVLTNTLNYSNVCITFESLHNEHIETGQLVHHREVVHSSEAERKHFHFRNFISGSSEVSLQKVTFHFVIYSQCLPSPKVPLCGPAFPHICVMHLPFQLM